MRHTQYINFLFLFAGIALVVGCGKSREIGDVTGSVTYKGAAVTGGQLVFHTPEGVYTTSIGEDGKYSLSQVPAGEATVTINTEGLNPNKKTPTYDPRSSAKSGAGGKYGGKSSTPPSVPKGGGKMKAETSPPPEGASTGSPGIYVKIPKEYADLTKSPLKVTVKTGKQELNLELKD